MAAPPTFTVIMGCNGAGKTTWKRANYDRLPPRHYDLDAVAGGIGDWNDPQTQRRALKIAHAEIDLAIAARQDFGTETTYAGRRGPGMVQQLREQGYRIKGIYIGTEFPTSTSSGSPTGCGVSPGTTSIRNAFENATAARSRTCSATRCSTN